MGFDYERVITDTIDDGLICSICSEVLDRPVMIDICEHTYCTDCINGWIKVNKICPQDRIPINTKQLVSIPRFMRNQLDGIMVRCKFFASGCAYTTFLGNIDVHEKSCLFDEINTRVDRRIETESLDLCHLQRIGRHRHKYEYEVIRFSMSEESKKVAIKLAKEALFMCGRVNFGQIAAYMKTHLEPEENKLWHCIVGTDYDCMLTANHFFITLKIDGIYIVAFKTK